MDVSAETILVAGITGHVGGAVARRLLQDGWWVRGLTRDPSKPAARELAARGAWMMRGDLDDPRTLEPAVEGCHGVFMELANAADPDVERGQGHNLVDAAVGAGVKHFVYSSIGGPAGGTTVFNLEAKRENEHHLREVGLPSTVWRPSYYMENLLSQREAILAGWVEWPMRVLPFPHDLPVQFIAIDDIAAFVALSFREPERFVGATMAIAGDELTGPEAAEVLSRVVGRSVGAVPPVGLAELPPDKAEMAKTLIAFRFQAYIDACRQMLPTLKTLEQWLRATGWEDAAARAA